jgi:hypothetical protein
MGLVDRWQAKLSSYHKPNEASVPLPPKADDVGQLVAVDVCEPPSA